MADWQGVPFDCGSTREPLQTADVTPTADGGYRIRDRRARAAYRFRLVFSYIDLATAQALEAAYQTAPGQTGTLVWSDGQAYECHHVGAPRITHLRGPYWRCDVELVGVPL